MILSKRKENLMNCQKKRASKQTNRQNHGKVQLSLHFGDDILRFSPTKNKIIKFKH